MNVVQPTFLLVHIFVSTQNVDSIFDVVSTAWTVDVKHFHFVDFNSYLMAEFGCFKVPHNEYLIWQILITSLTLFPVVVEALGRRSDGDGMMVVVIPRGGLVIDAGARRSVLGASAVEARGSAVKE